MVELFIAQPTRLDLFKAYPVMVIRKHFLCKFRAGKSLSRIRLKGRDRLITVETCLSTSES